MEYPKVHSLWKRKGWYFDEQCKKDPSKQKGRQSFIVGDYACEEFGNIRFGGRTKDAQIPCHLLDYLQSTFTPSLLNARFADKAGIGAEVILFGEGYGPKIQSGGYYSTNVGFCLFDVKVGSWWLEKSVVRHKVAEELGVTAPPCLMTEATEYEIVEFVKEKHFSRFATNDPHHKAIMEGVMCRPSKLMLFRNGDPIMFKLKCKEFV